MDNEYWNLFWMTGMPSAWVLSHGRSEVSPPQEQREPGDGSGPEQEGGAKAPY